MLYQFTVNIQVYLKNRNRNSLGLFWNTCRKRNAADTNNVLNDRWQIIVEISELLTIFIFHRVWYLCKHTYTAVTRNAEPKYEYWPLIHSNTSTLVAPLTNMD